MGDFQKENLDIAWCPGCGNYLILNALKEALQELELERKNTVLVSGIGQAAKLPQYLNCNYFNGLHGRAIPVATGVKLANKDLKVIVTSGDGDIYSEGGNHFIHAICRNPDLTVIVSNNMVYGLTKGQVSPTSFHCFKPKSEATQFKYDFNPISTAIALDASFVSRSFCQNQPHLKSMIKQAVSHKGFALLDVFSSCVTFNTTNTYDWFKEKTYEIDNSHDTSNKIQAFEKSLEHEKLPIGVFYKVDKTIFEEDDVNLSRLRQAFYKKEKPDKERLFELINKYR